MNDESVSPAEIKSPLDKRANEADLRGQSSGGLRPINLMNDQPPIQGWNDVTWTAGHLNTRLF